VVTADDPDQLATALEVMKLDGLWLCKTVLETFVRLLAIGI